jgi:predicted O-methyltransferase YrrM
MRTIKTTTTSSKLKYHSDWFSEHESAYDQILEPRLAAIAEGARALVIGTVEGRSVEWLLNHMNAKPEIVILERPITVKDKEPHCVATRGVGVRVSEAEVRNTLKSNLEKLESRRPDAKIRLVEKATTQGLVGIASSSKKPYDVVLIDSMSSKHALECAIFTFTVLRPGGTMVFTNYTHGKTHDASCARRGIDGFLDAYVSEIQTLRIAFHLFLERRKVPFAMPLECHAEVYDPNPDPEPEKLCK